MHDEKFFKPMVIAAQRAYTRGLQTGSGGNLSCRFSADSMYVKSSGGSFADCKETGEGFVLTDFDGRVVQENENVKPTREVLLHGALYRALPNINGVMHCHSPWSISWSNEYDILPNVTWHSQLKFDCEIPIVDIQAAVVPKESLHIVTDLFNQNPQLPAVILRGHGIVAVGNNIIDAEHVAELVEETAQIAFLQTILHTN